MHAHGNMVKAALHGQGAKPPFIVACSGGPDSVFLAHAVRDAYPDERHHLVYVNHQLRLDEIDDEIALVRELGNRLNMTVHIKTIQPSTHSQQHYRNERLNVFKQLAREHQCVDVILGHHADDDLETVMMQVLKGATMYLRGIPVKSDHPPIVCHHPLLHLTKAEILQSLKDSGIAYATDSSNLTTSYRRNDIRQAIRQWLPKDATAFTSSLNYLKQTSQAIEAVAQRFREQVIQIGGDYLLLTSIILNTPNGEWAIKMMVESITQVGMNQTEYEKMIRMLHQGSLKHCPIGTDFVIDIDYKWLRIRPTVAMPLPVIQSLAMGITPVAWGDCCVTQWSHEVVSTPQRLGVSMANIDRLKVTTIEMYSGTLPPIKNALRNAGISPVEQRYYPVVTLEEDAVFIPNIWVAGGAGDGVVTVCVKM